MCGLAGELRFKGTCDESVLHRMLSAIQYRGPDSKGIYRDGAVGLTHARLAIIDLSAAGNQPMRDAENELVLVFNGVIYNYRALRRRLIDEGQCFASHSDTEVILKSYACWGEDCVQYLDGIFAFAIWDARRRRLFLARDRLGIKPLYYTRHQNYFRFASSPQALLAAGNVDTTIHPAALHHHLTLHAVVPAPLTLLKGVNKLRPAHTMTVHADGHVDDNRYWRLKPKRLVCTNENDWLEGLEEELMRAIKVRYQVADVPTGVLLSGGLDSSLLVALVSRLNGNELNTYSVGFEDEGDEQGSEFEYSDLVAQQYGTKHHRIHVDNRALFGRLFEVVKYMAEPMVSQDCAGFYLLAEQVSRDIKVVQTGQGADEVFGGYFWYALMGAAKGSNVERFRPFYFDRSHDEFSTQIGKKFHVKDFTSALISNLFDENKSEEFLNTVLNIDVTTLVVDDPVKRVDNMTMAWGLEARVPFLAPALVEYAAAMPATLKLREGGKYPLKQIARRYLPSSIIDRPKAYFPVPALRYLSGRFLELANAVLNSDLCVRRELFNRTYVADLLSHPEKYITPIKGSQLWHCVVLELWLQHHIDGVDINVFLSDAPSRV